MTLIANLKNIANPMVAIQRSSSVLSTTGTSSNESDYSVACCCRRRRRVRININIFGGDSGCGDFDGCDGLDD
ncbi:hypothetical protein SAMD00019534_061810 [Acytostelium subglobosum LB1]|uniref:hypothetical protein n=1 Tax=Acytostelium subglobosum LB1 TaxID=1410327 RepID=UPI0006450164|nr:hypothetical protein SAMD00019534_061810 [Acytostelium subglobosum LB1]GAM23006.1 hypothetical protein SAMD00019534_061810 [Acytostelium subglobosum LB1]|eukprot:XP_012754233.1 hypothetical protein SAMD00019534_061810 [Acytostelium subglobosum LB1]